MANGGHGETRVIVDTDRSLNSKGRVRVCAVSENLALTDAFDRKDGIILNDG